MQCNKCEKKFDQVAASCGAGTTWSLYVCSHCGWKHYSGYHFPCESIWQSAKDGKASIDFGPQHMLHNIFIGPFAGLAIGYNAGYAKKVFCQSCKHIEDRQKNCTAGIPVPGEPQNMVCNAPDNIIAKSHDTWFQNVKNITRKQLPRDINKDNNCPWYAADPAVCIGTEPCKNI